MIEITRNNFSYAFPSVAFAIENSDFISIDTEFTGLVMNDQVKPSLFDSSTERYGKLKKSVGHFSLLQIGLSTFRGNTAENRYDVSSYNFHLCPVSFCTLSPTISIQASAIEFLNKHNFDFNKSFKEGISYMNCKQEQQVIEDLKNGYQATDFDSQPFDEEIQNVCSLVAAWICKEKSEQFLTLPLDEVSASSVISIHDELRRRFSQIWTSTNQFNQIVVEKVSPERRAFLEKENKENEETQKEQHLLDALGFTRIFRLLVQSKKPIIGHNMFMDLLFMYDKFHNPLPGSLSTFKQDLHNMFPLIFDTKHLDHTLRKEFDILKSVRARKLDDLHAILESQKVIGMALMHPSIHKVINENTPDESQGAPHHAGYDAFQCGCVFLRFCHLTYFRNHLEMLAVPFRSYLIAMKNYTNCVNVIRATINHIKLDGDEPNTDRPPLLHISIIKSKELLIPTKLSSWLSVYGTVDIRMTGTTQAIVATSNYMVARDILYSFKNHPTIRVTRYKFWQHSTMGKVIRWSSFLLATGLCVTLLYDALRK